MLCKSLPLAWLGLQQQHQHSALLTDRCSAHASRSHLFLTPNLPDQRLLRLKEAFAQFLLFSDCFLFEDNFLNNLGALDEQSAERLL